MANDVFENKTAEKVATLVWNGTEWISQGAAYFTRSDTYTIAANGTTIDVSNSPTQSFTIQVKGTGAAATAWDVRLEGSLDGTNFSQIIQHTDAVGDGVLKSTGTTFSPVLYFRSRCASITLGSATDIVVTILGER